MTFFAACAWSLMRSLVVAVLGVMVATQLKRTLTGGRGKSVPRWRRTLLWSLLLLPVFVPGLLIGYGYRNFSLSLVHHPFWNELVYASLVLFMVVPVGTLILVCSLAPPVSRSALHVAKMRGGPAGWNCLWLRHHLFALLPAAAAMFLLTFQETEVAALMQAQGWPEWMFTRLAMGLTLTTALLRLLAPVVIQLVIVAAAVWIIRDGLRDRSSSVESPLRGSSRRVASWTYLSFAITCLLIVPGGLVLRGSIEGFAVLRAHPALMSQIGIALLFGVTAGLLAWLMSGVIVNRLHQSWGVVTACCVLLPGLLGSWTLGVTLAEVFQTPLLRPLYGTPLPMILGEVLLQLPRAVLIRLLLGRLSDSTTIHSARMLASAPNAAVRHRAADILWRLDVRGRVLGAFIVCYWASMELTIPGPALLGPPGMTTAPVLLYNQMHYGLISGLSALVLAAIAVPVVCLIGLSLAARHLTGWLRPIWP